MTALKAAEYLGLVPAGSAGRVKRINPFGRRSEAEKRWQKNAARLGLKDGQLGREYLDIERTDYRVMLAWEQMCKAWCHKCRCIALKPHYHCEECGRLLRVRESIVSVDHVEVKGKCAGCGEVFVDVID